MSEPDYPAAHSTDTLWYAVDAAGHVAAFWSDEDGPIPSGTPPESGIEFLYAWWEEWRPGVRWPDGGRSAACGQLGLYLFQYEDETFHPFGWYRRDVGPGRPLHVDQLPPAVRAECTRRFDGLDFARTEVVQPYEWFPCVGLKGNQPAYLWADGATLSPVPGREGRFWEFFAEAVRDPAGWRFEGIEVGPDRVTLRAIPGDPQAFWDFFRRLQRERPTEAQWYYFELNADAP